MEYIKKMWGKEADGCGGRRWRRRQTGKIAFALALIMSVTQLQTVLADTVTDANNKKNEAQQGLDSAQSQMNAIKQEQQALQEEIDALDAELVEVIRNVTVLENEIAETETTLMEIQGDLEIAREDEAEQYENMKKRIQFMYERGDTAFLSAILESSSMADFINRVGYVNEMYAYDRQLLTDYQNTKQAIEDMEAAVQTELAALEEKQVSYQQEKQKYEAVIARKQGEMSDFDSKLASAKKLAAQYQATITRQNEIIKAEEERAASGGNENPGYSTDVSGAAVVEYAKKFIGNKYVYGGTDINNGIDCSAFVQYVYRHFGINLPRTSYEQRSVGKKVSYANAQPGDIICYDGHVAIYIGNGAIIHASNSAPYPDGGIKISSNAQYKDIISVRRVL